MACKTADPKLLSLLDRKQKALAEFERNYAKARRAWNRMEKAKRKLARLVKQIDQHHQNGKD